MKEVQTLVYSRVTAASPTLGRGFSPGTEVSTGLGEGVAKGRVGDNPGTIVKLACFRDGRLSWQSRWNPINLVIVQTILETCTVPILEPMT